VLQAAPTGGPLRGVWKGEGLKPLGNPALEPQAPGGPAPGDLRKPRTEADLRAEADEKERLRARQRIAEQAVPRLVTPGDRRPGPAPLRGAKPKQVRGWSQALGGPVDNVAGDAAEVSDLSLDRPVFAAEPPGSPGDLSVGGSGPTAVNERVRELMREEMDEWDAAEAAAAGERHRKAQEVLAGFESRRMKARSGRMKSRPPGGSLGRGPLQGPRPDSGLRVCPYPFLRAGLGRLLWPLVLNI
jgi:hypothetical protein